MRQPTDGRFDPGQDTHMSQEILINITPRETRVALVENGSLEEVNIERERRRGLVGNVYMGQVRRVLPGMQAAFVEVGLQRTAFMHASDIAPPEPIDPAETPLTGSENIADLVPVQQRILVQVIRDTIGTKGARLTTHITIPSLYLVLLPSGKAVVVSTRIEDEEERARLKAIGKTFLDDDDEGHGYILRTAAEGAAESALRADREFLIKLWESIRARAEQAQPG